MMKSLFKTTVFLLSILAGITVSSQLGLQSPGFVGQLSKKPSSSCATTDTSIPHDLFLEGWQTDGGENTWAGGVDGNGVTYTKHADTTSLTTDKPTGACDRALKVDVVSDSTTENTMYHDLGAAIDLDTQAVEVSFYIYISTIPDSGEDPTILSMSSTTANNSQTSFSWLLYAKNDAGTMQLQVYGTSGTGYVNVPSNEWVRVTVHLDTTNTASTATIDGSSPITFTRRASLDPRYIHIGTVASIASGDSISYYIDLFSLD